MQSSMKTIKDYSKMIYSRVKVNMSGQMEEIIVVIGGKVKWMGLENSIGRMAVNI